MTEGVEDFQRTFARGRACAKRREQERHCRIIAMSLFQREPRDLGVLENGLVVAQERQFWGDLAMGTWTVFWHTPPESPYDLPPLEIPDTEWNPYQLPPIELPEPHPFDPEND